VCRVPVFLSTKPTVGPVVWLGLPFACMAGWCGLSWSWGARLWSASSGNPKALSVSLSLRI
jgi:hypothetical protein